MAGLVLRAWVNSAKIVPVWRNVTEYVFAPSTRGHLFSAVHRPDMLSLPAANADRREFTGIVARDSIRSEIVR